MEHKQRERERKGPKLREKLFPSTTKEPSTLLLCSWDSSAESSGTENKGPGIKTETLTAGVLLVEPEGVPKGQRW